jgi:magnesium-transporting ATPase (P-type)
VTEFTKGSTADERPGQAAPPAARGAGLLSRARRLVQAINEGDEARVETAVLQLSRSKRIFAPLTFAVGALTMLFQGVKMLFSDWRLSLVQILPAMWIWAAMLDLKLHVVGRREFNLWYGWPVVIAVLVVVVVSVASFYLNAVFAFAISGPGKPVIGAAFAMAGRHLGVVATFGFVVGSALGFSVVVVPRWGLSWFAFSTSIVLAVMMLTYVTVPSRLVGIKPASSPRDKLAASVVAGAVGVIVCTPPYLLARVGILLLGTHNFFVPGIILIVVGFALQSGATGAVKAVKMSSKLVTGNVPAGT